MHGDVLARWFVFTDRETWWHDEGLDVELRRSEAILAPATADDDVLLVGGGGLLPFDRFLILSRAAVSKLADGAFLGACRERLRACDPNERRLSRRGMDAGEERGRTGDGGVRVPWGMAVGSHGP